MFVPMFVLRVTHGAVTEEQLSICPWMDGSRTTQELLPRSNTPVDSTDLFRIMMPAERGL